MRGNKMILSKILEFYPERLSGELTQEKLAKKIGVSRATVNRWEKKIENNPFIKSLRRLNDKLERTIQDPNGSAEDIAQITDSMAKLSAIIRKDRISFLSM
jgi:transcriptional regulator with XRE-family HTH domain